MANLLVWGKARELISGALPPGITIEESPSLAELRQAVDGSGGSLVLVDPARLELERAAAEAWLNGLGSRRPVLALVVSPEESDEAVRRYPFLDDLLVKPVTVPRLRLCMDRTLETINSRRVI